MSDPLRECLEGLKENGDPGLLRIGVYPFMGFLQTTTKKRMNVNSTIWIMSTNQASVISLVTLRFWGIPPNQT